MARCSSIWRFDEAWMSWLEGLTSEEQWQLHYEDLTLGNSLMSTLDKTPLKKPLEVGTNAEGAARAIRCTTALHRSRPEGSERERE